MIFICITDRKVSTNTLHSVAEAISNALAIAIITGVIVSSPINNIHQGVFVLGATPLYEMFLVMSNDQKSV